jgi:tetratricopeptide (TPR) repeat protein
MLSQFRKLFLLLTLISGVVISASAQIGNNTNAEQLFTTAQKFINSGDYANAIIVLNQAIQQEPANINYRQELAFAYYLGKNYDRADDIIEPLIKNDEAGIMTYEIAGNIAESKQDYKNAIKIFDRSIRKFPNSGELYNDMGLLYFSQEKYDPALHYWIKGIQMDPQYASNYYEASRTYYYSTDKVWAIIYGEIFINLESFSLRTAEIKGILLDSYKKLFDNPQMLTGNLPGIGNKDNNSGANFHQAFLQVLAKESSVISRGVTPETLIMLRTRFLLDWYNFYALKFPFALFDYERNLVKQGLFDTYNQWIFGPGANQAAYKNWMNMHPNELNEFLNYHHDHPLQLRDGQFYNDGKFSFDSNSMNAQ